MTLAMIAPPLLFAVFLWWFSTGAIIWLDRLPRKTFAISFSVGSAVAAAALYGVIESARDETAANAYIGFACAIAIWGWHEMSFLMGFIVGPHRQTCPADARGWRRFKLAAATLIHHEIALAVTILAIVALTWGQPNQIAALTFLVLWAMRLSTKFNLFFGAPYRSEEMLPGHLAHLKTYFRNRRMNPLFPISLASGLGLVWALCTLAFSASATPHEQTGFLLLLAITGLAVVEHVFLFIPPPNALLWGWAAPETARHATPPHIKAEDAKPFSVSGSID